MTSKTSILAAARCCLLVVDPQEKLMKAIPLAEQVTANTGLLIRCAKALAMPVIATTQYRKGLGPFVPELDALLADCPQVDKLKFNAFACAGTAELLNRLPAGVDTLILAGAEAHICIYQTAVGALEAGYTVWVAADAVASRNKENADLALARMQTLGIAVGPAEMIIYQLLHKAGTPAFKAMLPYLK